MSDELRASEGSTWQIDVERAQQTLRFAAGIDALSNRQTELRDLATDLPRLVATIKNVAFLTAENAKLREYARHGGECARWAPQRYSLGGQSIQEVLLSYEKCTCGLDALLSQPSVKASLQ